MAMGDAGEPTTAPRDLDHAFALFEARTNLERGGTPHLRQYRLERMGEILHLLGDPHRVLPAIHLAGSKGKGSTAVFTAFLAAASGLKVGLYTSPHVTGYRERFRLIGPAGEEFRHDLLFRESVPVWRVVESMRSAGTPEDDLPTTFELLTALAFRFFSAAECQVVVLETGLGGRLDATNLCHPVMTMITRIELEHQEYLGETVQEIAREKGGIIKEGVPVVIAPQRRVVRQVLERIARERNASVLPMGDTSEIPAERLGMAGAVQRINAAQALTAVRHLYGLSKGSTIAAALGAAHLPGRGEQVEDLVLDGAHTPESVAQAIRALRGRGSVVILGIVSGKDVAGIVGALKRTVRHVVVSRPGTFKPGNPESVYQAVLAAGIPAELHLDPARALERARELNGKQGRTAGGSSPILVTGSFYMVGEIRRLVRGGDS